MKSIFVIICLFIFSISSVFFYKFWFKQWIFAHKNDISCLITWDLLSKNKLTDEINTLWKSSIFWKSSYDDLLWIKYTLSIQNNSWNTLQQVSIRPFFPSYLVQYFRYLSDSTHSDVKIPQWWYSKKSYSLLVIDKFDSFWQENNYDLMNFIVEYKYNWEDFSKICKVKLSNN